MNASRGVAALLVTAATILGLVEVASVPPTDAADPSQLRLPSWQLQLPWPLGMKHYIFSEGNGYNCGDHLPPNDTLAIDFQMAIGDAVSAVASGVAHRGTQGSVGYGNFIWIDHGGGIISLYGHLSDYVVADNATVSRGQTIGKAGNTGYTTGPHLHFALRANATDWTNGIPQLPEPMSGYTGFRQYGQCASPPASSPMYNATAPAPPTVTIQGAFLTDQNDHFKGVFACGDVIRYGLSISSPTPLGRSITPTFTWDVLQHNSGRPEIYFLKKATTVSTGIVRGYTQGNIPNDAPSGVYDYYLFVTYSDRTAVGLVEFTVNCT